MRGRDIFKIVDPILTLGVAILRLLPHRLVAATYWMVYWIPGHLGIGLRYMYARRLCRKCGKNVRIERLVDIRYWDRLSLGSNVSLNTLVYIDALGGIEIRDDCGIGHMSSILAFEHGYWEDPKLSFKDNRLIPQPITIGPDTAVGCGARVLGGVNLGERIMLGANSVATRDLTAPGLYGGTPAKLLRTVPPPPAKAAAQPTITASAPASA